MWDQVKLTISVQSPLLLGVALYLSQFNNKNKVWEQGSNLLNLLIELTNLNLLIQQ